MRMLNPQGQPGEGFADVPADSYYYNEITLAKALGIANGSGGNQFNPRDKITRQDMMTLTYRALVQMGYLKEGNTDTSGLNRFSDAGMVADYAKVPLARLVEAGLIQGSGDRLTPTSHATRAEVAVFLYRIFQNYL